MNYISDILYWISTGLLVPVIVLLIILFVRSLLLIGSFFGQYILIRKTESFFRHELDSLDFENAVSFADRLPAGNTSSVVECMRRMVKMKSSPAHLERLISDYEINADKDLAVSKTLSKMGPMLGLMGTLIPMGPALVGLSTGDISSMAYNMQVAFATTVVGLFAAAVGFITLQVKQRWYMQDLTNLEFLKNIFVQNCVGK